MIAKTYLLLMYHTWELLQTSFRWSMAHSIQGSFDLAHCGPANSGPSNSGYSCMPVPPQFRLLLYVWPLKCINSRPLQLRVFHGLDSPSKMVNNFTEIQEVYVSLQWLLPVVFGDNVLAQSSRSGKNGTNQLDPEKSQFIRSIIHNRVRGEFELVRKKCLDSLGNVFKTEGQKIEFPHHPALKLWNVNCLIQYVTNHLSPFYKQDMINT